MKDIGVIKALAEDIRLPKEACEVAIPICERVILAFAEDYLGITKNKKDASLIYALAGKLGMDRDAVMLAVVLMLGADAHDLYVERGISEEIYLLSMRDITVWSKTYMKMKGHVGVSEYGWLINFIEASIVRIHRLEFHEITFLHGKTWSRAGVTIRGGEPVINIHIPEDGALNHDDVIESYRQAYRYFNASGLQAFVCDSWLLYPGNYDFLPENSNIRKFMDDFDIIKIEKTKNNGDLWRVFGPCWSYDTSTFPRETSLQRNMIKYLDEHDNVTGSGYGIFLFDGDKIVR